MYNLHHETNSEPNLSLSTFKPLLKVSTSTHSTSAHTLNVGLTNCLIPAPARTESCQRHTAGTTCRLLSPCTRPLTAPLSVTPSLTGLNDALQPNRTASPPRTPLWLWPSLRASRGGGGRKREGIPPEEIGSCSSGNACAPQMRRVLNRKGQQVGSKNGRDCTSSGGDSIRRALLIARESGWYG